MELFFDDKDLLLKVAEGNEHAFNYLFDLHHQALALHILRITRSTDLAEEVVQDVFLKIWVNRHQLRGVDNIRAYLYTLSKNHAINCLRREARQREQQKKIEEASLELQYIGTPADNLNYLLFDEAIDNLPDQQKTAFLLSRHNRLTYVQIADRMGISHETVKTYLKRATNAITNYINNRTTLLVGLIIIKYFVILFKLMTPFFS